MYFRRESPESVTLETFQSTLRQTEKLEYRMAMNKEKLSYHFRKWGKYCDIFK